MSMDSERESVSGVAKGAGAQAHSSSGTPRISGVSGQRGRRPEEVTEVGVSLLPADFLEATDDRVARAWRKRSDLGPGGPGRGGGEIVLVQ